MAIVQISKIQVRRGVKGESDVPALEPGEFGWAIDTHELYIGNDRSYDYFYDQQVYDSTGYEPFVPGSMYNTRILTTNDFNKITELAKYRYSDPSNHFVISLQEKLEQVVYVEDFGASIDLLDNVVEFQKAVNRIGVRRVLHLQPGTYKIGSSVSIPSNIMIQGSGIDETIIEFANDGFVLANEVSIKGVTLRSKNNATPLLTVNGSNVVLNCNVEYEDFGNIAVDIAASNDTITAQMSITNCNVGISAQTLMASHLNFVCHNVTTSLSSSVVADSDVTVNGSPVSISTLMNSHINLTDYRNVGQVLPGSGKITYTKNNESGDISILNGNIVSHESITTQPESDILINSPVWQTISGIPVNYTLSISA